MPTSFDGFSLSSCSINNFDPISIRLTGSLDSVSLMICKRSFPDVEKSKGGRFVWI